MDGVTGDAGQGKGARMTDLREAFFYLKVPRPVCPHCGTVTEVSVHLTGGTARQTIDSMRAIGNRRELGMRASQRGVL